MINWLGLFSLLLISSCGSNSPAPVAAPQPSPIEDTAEKADETKKDTKEKSPTEREFQPPGKPPARPLPPYGDKFNPNGKNGLWDQDGDNYCKNRPDGPQGSACNTGLDIPCQAGEIVCREGKSYCQSLIASCGLQNFLAARPFPVSDGPTSVASGDFNGDGFGDQAVTNPADNTISILLGDANGTLGAPTSIAILGMPVNIAAGDLNGDQILDLVTVNASSNNTNVCLGSGTGTFMCLLGPATGNLPSGLALAYLDDNTFLDLVVTNSSDNTVSVFFGNNDGTFSLNALYASGSGPAAVSVGDLDGQNGADLVVVNPLSDNISVYLNSGLGTFAPQVVYGGLFNPSGAALGDLDNDGDLDVAVANEDDDSVTIFYNNGLGILALLDTHAIHIMLANYNVCDNPSAIEARDLDQDNDIDLAISCFTGAITVLTNDGDSFSRQDYTTASDAQDISISDVNADGYPDLLVTTDEGQIVVFLGSVNGTFSAVTSDFNCLSARGVALGDVDQDGDLDIAIACPGEGNTKVHLNNGDGTFGTSAPYLAVGSAVSVALSDVNGDTFADLIILEKTSSNIRVFFNDQDGTFSFNADYSATLSTPQSMIVTDIGGDGDNDIIVTNLGTNSITLFFNNGLGIFSTVVNDVGVLLEPRDVVAANLDNIGGMDAVIAWTGSDLFEVRRSGTENVVYSTKTTYPLAVGSKPRGVAVGDLNKDGFIDIAVAESGTDKVTVAFNNPMSLGNFIISPTQYDVGPNPISIVLTDANLDGNLDIITANEDDGTITLVSLDSSLNVISTVNYIVGNTPFDLVAGRLDDDLDPDLVTSISGEDGMSIVLNINE